MQKDIILALIDNLASLLTVAFGIFLVVRNRKALLEMLPRVSKLKVLGVEAEFIKDDLQKASEKFDQKVSSVEEACLIERIAFINKHKIALKGIWIDDNPDNNRHETKLLEDMGISIVAATTSENALNLILANSFDIILSDIERPGDKNGIEFLKELVEQNMQDIPTIFYAGKLQRNLGVPPYAFGITNRPLELAHLCLDVMARKIKTSNDEP